MSLALLSSVGPVAAALGEPGRDSERPENGKATSGPNAGQLRSAALLRVAKAATYQDLTTAATDLTQSATLFQSTGLNAAAAADYLSLGEIYLIVGRYAQALKTYRLALSLTRPSDLDLRCSILSHLATTYVAFGDIKQSFRYSQQAVTVAHGRISASAKAEAFEALGASLLYSDLDRAVELFQSAAENLKTAGDIEREAGALRYLGLALSSAGFFHAALAQHSRALELWTSTGNIRGIALAHAALGLLWVDLEEPDRALAEYAQAQPVFRVMNDRDNEAIVLNGMGWINQDLANYEDALQYYEQSRRIFAAIGDDFGEIAAISGAAKASWSLGRFDRARALYSLKSKRALKADQHRAQASALLDRGDLYVRAKKYIQARRAYNRALALCQSQNHPILEAELYIHLGRLYAGTSQSKQAIKSFSDALKIGKLNSGVTQQPELKAQIRLPVQAEAHYQLAKVYGALHQLSQAKTESENSIQLIESERVKVSDFDSRASYFASVHEYYQLYIDILTQLHQRSPEQHFDQQAFEAAEKSKVRSLLDMLAGSDTAPSASNLQQIQDGIRGDDAVLLEYSLGPDASQLWAVEEGHLYSYRLPGEAEIAKLAAAYGRDLIARQPLAREDVDHYNKRVAKADAELPIVSRQLSEMLFGPVAHLLGRKRILIVPDGSLRYIPFAALPFPAKDDQPLAAGHELVSLPSASILNALRQAVNRRPQPTALAAVFADPVFSKDDPRISGRPSGASALHSDSVALGAALRDTGFGTIIPRLPNSRIEAKTIAEAWPGKEVLSALDFDASRNAVLAANLDRYRYIHFATHGLLDSKHPEFSGLILSLFNSSGQPDDGYLRIRDIYSLKLAADLVVLSSCNSASGKDLQSEGIIGLPRAFLYAGSQRVISTLWKIDDRASAALMNHFYSRIRDGESPSSALRAAQMALAGDPHWGHPYFWAAFILQGEYR